MIFRIIKSVVSTNWVIVVLWSLKLIVSVVKTNRLSMARYLSAYRATRDWTLININFKTKSPFLSQWQLHWWSCFPQPYRNCSFHNKLFLVLQTANDKQYIGYQVSFNYFNKHGINYRKGVLLNQVVEQINFTVESVVNFKISKHYFVKCLKDIHFSLDPCCR